MTLPGETWIIPRWRSVAWQRLTRWLAFVLVPPDHPWGRPATLAHNPVDIALNCSRVAKTRLLVSCDFRPACDAAYGPGTSIADLCRHSTFYSQIRDVGLTEEGKVRFRQATYLLVKKVSCFRGSIASGYAFLLVEEMRTFDVVLILRRGRLQGHLWVVRGHVFPRLSVVFSLRSRTTARF